MLSLEQLREMQHLNIEDAAWEDLADLGEISLGEGGFEDRVLAFLEQVRNPYAFRVGAIRVKIAFAEEGPSLEETLVKYLTTLHTGQ